MIVVIENCTADALWSLLALEDTDQTDQVDYLEPHIRPSLVTCSNQFVRFHQLYRHPMTDFLQIPCNVSHWNSAEVGAEVVVEVVAVVVDVVDGVVVDVAVDVVVAAVVVVDAVDSFELHDASNPQVKWEAEGMNQFLGDTNLLLNYCEGPK